MTDMRTEKRKNEDLVIDRFSHRMIAALSMGVAFILLMSVGALLWYAQNTAAPAPTPRLIAPAPTQVPVVVYMQPTVPPPAQQPQWTLPDGRLVYSTRNSTLIMNFDGDGSHGAGKVGSDVTAAPGKQLLAYTRSGTLYLFSTVTQDERQIETPGTVRMPAWNSDGTALTFVVSEGEPGQSQDVVYRYELGTQERMLRLLAVPAITAPPAFSPDDRRILIAEQTGATETDLYTIAADCPVNCSGTRENLAVVRYAVTWAEYHPNGTFIGFTAQDSQTVYGLPTADAVGEPKILYTHTQDGAMLRRFAFSSDGLEMVYADDFGNTYAVHLGSKAVMWLAPTDVASVDWVE